MDDPQQNFCLLFDAKKGRRLTINIKNKSIYQIKLYYVYKLTTRGYGSRETEKMINNNFMKFFNKKIIREYEIIDICKKYSIKRKGVSKKYKYYEKDFEKKLAIKLYTEFYNTQKVIQYMKEKHNIDFTEQQLRILAHNAGKKKILRQNTVTVSKYSYLEEQQIVKDYLNGMTLMELANKYNYKTHGSIIGKLKKYNIVVRTKKEVYDKNKTYKDFSFKRIDCDWKAYYLGLLLTDGCVQGTRLGLGLIDEDAIKFLSEKINVKYEVRKYKNDSRKAMYGIGIYSPELIEDIKRYGLVERKTWTLQPPKLYDDELKFLPYLFKGIIDGDGHISKDGKGFSIGSASKDFIYWCKDILESYFGMKNIIITHIKDIDFYNLHSSRKYNIEILKNTIYKDDMGMKRKYNRLHQIK